MSPKFYFFDTGVLRSIQRRLNTVPQIGIEVKSKTVPHKADFYSGYLALRAVHKKAKFFCAHTGDRQLLIEGLDALPFGDILTMLRAL